LIVGVAELVVVPVLFVTLLFVSVFVLDIEGMTTHSTASTPAEERERVVSLAAHSSIDPTHRAVLVDAVMPATGRPVQFVSVPEEGVPNAHPDVRLPLAVPVKAPTKVVAPKAFVLELYVSPVFVLGHKLPVAAVKNAGKQVVSDASFATVISVGVPPALPLLAAVISPFPLTVIFAFVKEPTLLFTVASVRAVAPVASPVCVALLTRPE